MSSFKTTTLGCLLVAHLCLNIADPLAAQTFRTLQSFQYPAYTGILNSLTWSNNSIYGTSSGGGDAGNGTVFVLESDGSALSNLHSFTATSTNALGIFTNSDGVGPMAGLILSGNVLYGTTTQGGAWGNGTIFKLNSDGSGFTALHNFTEGTSLSNTDGVYPNAELVVSGNQLYGTTEWGGSFGWGTVFALATDGTGFRTLHTFTRSDGNGPNSSLVLTNNSLYGTTFVGTLYRLSTDGTGFITLHSFGAQPNGLLLSGDTFYGTIQGGGSSGNGAVFAVKIDGTGYTNLYSFSPLAPTSPLATALYTNSDGAGPMAGLFLSGDTLFGTTQGGGTMAWGNVFMLKTTGALFVNLHNFTDFYDGGRPQTGVFLLGNTLYGTTTWGSQVFTISLLPRLTIGSLGTNLVLSWPASFTNFSLESTTNLFSPIWRTISSGGPANGQTTVTNPVLGPGQFYRLSQ